MTIGDQIKTYQSAVGIADATAIVEMTFVFPDGRCVVARIPLWTENWQEALALAIGAAGEVDQLPPPGAIIH